MTSDLTLDLDVAVASKMAERISKAPKGIAPPVVKLGPEHGFGISKDEAFDAMTEPIKLAEKLLYPERTTRFPAGYENRKARRAKR